MVKRIAMAGLLARLMCVVAMLSLGVAHTPPQLAAVALETAALQLPDGTYADLCIGDHGERHPGQDLVKCEACLIGGASLLPLPDGEAWLISEFASLDNRPTEAVAIHQPAAVALPRSRGPPVLS
ncbi:hypothetical protein M8R20_15465 [Pseudomonas sp. R2.Fl]|nr:hypothetical protein [Pseudomonas sp. R2.Fl]